MALDMKNKKTSLEEDALIYEQRHEDNLSEKEKLSKMSSKEKRSYFSEYYSKPLLIAVVVLIVVGYLVWHDFIAKKTIIYRTAIMNETVTSENLGKFNENFTKYCKLDIRRNEAAFNTYYTNELATFVGATAMSDLQSVASQIYAATLDGMVADEKTFGTYLDNQFFTSMEDFLTPEEYQKLQQYLYVPDRKDNIHKKAYGIYLNQSPTYQTMVNDGSVNVKKPIFGLLFNSKEQERARDLLYYLFPNILGTRQSNTK